MNWKWIWPGTGPAPASDEPDAEIFDTDKVPLAHTFVREAVQNSLDAAPEGSQVAMRFSFGSDGSGSAAAILGQLKQFRQSAGQDWPASETVTWIAVEDSGTSGLRGDLDDRTSDFWNYWLNFGVSNKTGAGRGGRGVGRKTFLLVSGVKAVIGATRRDDGVSAVSGYAMLKPKVHEGRMRAGLAVLAKAEKNDVYELHPANAAVAALCQVFSVANRGDEGAPGFTLIVPYPDTGLTPQKIKAALIENFAPAIMGGQLVVDVDGQNLDESTIGLVASQVYSDFADQCFRDRFVVILDLLRKARQTPDAEIRVEEPGAHKRLKQIVGEVAASALRDSLQTKGQIVLKVVIPVVLNGVSEDCPVKIAIAEAPYGSSPVDEFYRAGMRLPNVISKSPGNIDVVILAEQGPLVTYLNLCEGKAHLDLLENDEVRKKLVEKGFEGPAVRRRVKRLPDEVREVVLPDATKPDSTLFAKFFTAPPRPGDGAKQPKKKKKSVAPPDPPAPRPTILRTVKVDQGFEVRVEPGRADKLTGATIRIKVAYASGSRKLDWHGLDFNVAKQPITVEHGACAIDRLAGNEIRCINCDDGFFVRVTGFDPKRELETDVAIMRPKSEDA